jgi:DNA-binding NarL/FixJ family response regulator
LVADDSPTALLSVCRYLEFEGKFEVLGTAADGPDLLHKAKNFRPDLVLTDLSMPRISGLEATTELRKLFPELRILIFTELNGFSLRDECLRCGADGFVEKSQMPEKLMEEVQRLFPRHS